MKKLIAMLLAVVLVMGLVACGSSDNTPTTTVGSNNTTPATTEAPKPTATTTEVLNSIWNAVPEDSRFPVYGGNIMNPVDSAAGEYDLSDENMPSTLYIPAEQVANLSSAATLIHFMNANILTCGMYTMADGADAQAFADAMKASLENTQWMCGMPDKLVIAVLDSYYVMVCFGGNDALAVIEPALSSVYPDAEYLYSGAIAG